MEQTFSKAIEFVKEHIKGTRKGSEIPQYQHSINVAQILYEVGQFDHDVIEAGLLHDILEDTDLTSSKLVRFGVSDRTIDIVELCSHDNDDDNSDARYLSMIANLIRSEDQEAWAVKLADTIDNIKTAHLMRHDRFMTYLRIKAPIMLHYTEEFEALRPLRTKLAQALLAQQNR